MYVYENKKPPLYSKALTFFPSYFQYKKSLHPFTFFSALPNLCTSLIKEGGGTRRRKKCNSHQRTPRTRTFFHALPITRRILDLAAPRATGEECKEEKCTAHDSMYRAAAILPGSTVSKVRASPDRLVGLDRNAKGSGFPPEVHLIAAFVRSTE